MAPASNAADVLSLALFDSDNEPSDFTGSPDPHSWLQDFAIAIEVVLPVLALVVCSLRCYIRVSTKNIGWDDYWIFGAMLLCIGQAVDSVIFIKVEFIGIHNVNIPPHDTHHPIFINYIGGLIYNPILSMVKVSVLIFLLRLAGTRPAVKATIWALMTFTTCMMIAIFFSVVFVCQPVQYNWDPKIKDGKCFDKRPFSIWTAAVAIFTDILVLALPFWIFLSLRMARKAKIALLCCFGLGGIVTIVGCVRLYFIYRSNYLPKSPDSNYNIGYVTTALETNLAVMAASGPALWPLARRWFPAFFENLGLSRGYQGHIPDIVETTMPQDELVKEETGGSSSRTRVFRLFSHKKAGGRVSVRPVRTRRLSGQGSHVNRTSGGGSLVLKNMRGDRARGRTVIRSHATVGSEEEMVAYKGIMRTTDYSVSRDDRSSGATEGSWVEQPSRGSGGQTLGRSSVGSI
ncbi:hypothetical protein CONLIGDRAFT_672360 [Coniochaeta ligniaria NRRL 30616]|uniref:Rhodopsin domain-containing protein n=1 Tax=Coniochaeta ligniaria NRRL 30616 TaxID=1408157 RepID=A0A1J7JGY6_9PEZI|nr:hypothetical protein CONLIGDRAFT_672360 [Coniochaeta ligniaria NRRL 30616]